jgi:hypothetical protein
MGAPRSDSKWPPDELADPKSGRRPRRPHWQAGLQNTNQDRRRAVSRCLISAAEAIGARPFPEGSSYQIHVMGQASPPGISRSHPYRYLMAKKRIPSRKLIRSPPDSGPHIAELDSCEVFNPTRPAERLSASGFTPIRTYILRPSAIRRRLCKCSLVSACCW